MVDNIVNLVKTMLFRIFGKENVDNKTWLFSSSYNMKFNYNSKYLFEYVLENEPSITPLYVINDDLLRKKLQKKYGVEYFIETKSFKGIKKALSSRVWFTSAGLPLYGFSFNKKRIVINLWHGVPLKKIGLLEKEQNKYKRFYFKKLFSENYSIILTTSDKLKELMADSFGVQKEKVKVLGQPRNDLLNNSIDKEVYFKKKFPELPVYNKLILYAPTYREFNKTKLFPFKDLNYNKLNEFLEKEKIIIFIRMHQSEINFNSFEELKNVNRIRFINDDVIEDIMEILSIFDLLITDYSSIYIDHLTLEKPQLFLPYDFNEYRELRGFNFEYDKYTPGPKVYKFNEFKNEIKQLLENSEYYKKERYFVNNYFNQVRSDSCEKIVKFTKEII